MQHLRNRTRPAPHCPSVNGVTDSWAGVARGRVADSHLRAIRGGWHAMQSNQASNFSDVGGPRAALPTATPSRSPNGPGVAAVLGASTPEAERTLELAREPEVRFPRVACAGERRTRGDDIAEAVRRVVNVVLAALALVALAPLMTLIALAVRLTSRGPIIYVQERVGLDRRRRAGGAAATSGGRPALYVATAGPPAAGAVAAHLPACAERRGEDVGGAPYRMYKFRTMRVDAESDGRPVWAAREDPRVTRVGRLLRRTRLDELPQLVNVLRGEMNLVGPRPERPAIAARLRHEVEGYALRYRVRPGITGWAQINHPYDTTLDDVRTKVRYDLEYLDRIQRGGVAEDLRILARTVPVMLGRRHGW
jgi:lipopolysaccharide/colanic/teichoic acid biosynthesis glycosyltransferase